MSFYADSQADVLPFCKLNSIKLELLMRYVDPGGICLYTVPTMEIGRGHGMST